MGGTAGLYGTNRRTFEEIFDFAEGKRMSEVMDYVGVTVSSNIFNLYYRRGLKFNGILNPRKKNIVRPKIGGKYTSDGMVQKDIMNKVFDNETGKYKVKCAHCGDYFYIEKEHLTDYAYKLFSHHVFWDGFCSWSCLRKEEKEREELFCGGKKKQQH